MNAISRAILKEGAKAAGPYAALADAKTAGAVTINYGAFINVVISFAIVAFAVFLLIRSINALRRREEAPAPPPSTKECPYWECPYCASAIPIKASRCPRCTSQLTA